MHANKINYTYFSQFKKQLHIANQIYWYKTKLKIPSILEGLDYLY